ncbi:carbohydrate ABC transporter permease [Actinocrispum wychmicini]|uniref:carbohydrate ABC transporter permease n=1 Tax=Actinocrispum wychmicini TaxID=1213861 RepID=UPI001A9F96FD|nr:carbohydrate ABC transporter permease [Actinocrispum wychmicini]
MIRKTGWYALLGVLSLIVLFPIYLTFVRALTPPVEFALQDSPLYPAHPQWSAFAEAWTRAGLGHAALQSLIMTVLITLAQVVTGVLAAYAFVFLKFPFRRLLFAVCMATMLLPIEVTLLANVGTIRDLHWIDSMQALVLPFGASAFGIFLLRQAFAGIPSEIKDASRLDGHGHLHLLFLIAVPLTRPVVASFTLIAALGAWGQYLWPRTVVESSEAATLQVALRGLSFSANDLNLLPAGALITAVPVLFLLIVFQRQIVRGLTAGAVKG